MQCLADGPACGLGDLQLVSQDSHVVRCVAGSGLPIVHYNRSMVTACLNHLPRAEHHNVSARLLVLGASTAYHLWHALGEDDSPSWDGWANARTRHPTCRKTAPDYSLSSFRPHSVDFSLWQAVTPGPVKMSRASPSCYRNGALGGGRLRNLTAFMGGGRPYDVVAILIGTWDASYTTRNESAFATELKGELSHLLQEWPQTRILIFTATPCGPSPTAGTPRATPETACNFVSTMNGVIRRLVPKLARQFHAHTALARNNDWRRAPPRISLIDAEQMVMAHPFANVAGDPPGLWQRGQYAGWHFEGAALTDTGWSRKMRDQLRAQHSAAGEMSRALANRIFDTVCPRESFAKT